MTDRILPDWIDAYLEYTENSEPARSYRLWTAISCIAACLQRKCRLPWGSLTFYPNFYVVLVGPSGKARKGTAMGPGQKLLRNLGINMVAEAITREALIRELANAKDSTIDPSTGVTKLHCSLTVFSKELTVFLGYQNQQLMSDLTDWYDCDDNWTYRTKTQGTDKVEGVWVNLIGATTPSLIATAMPLDAIGGGLTSRIIFVYEPRKGKTVAVPMWTSRERELEVQLERDLEQIYMLQGDFTTTADFLDVWVPWYTAADENHPFDDDRFAGYFERRGNHALKLAVILSASRSNSMIVTGDDLSKALDILDMTERKMPAAVSGAGKSSQAETLIRVWTELGMNGEMTMTDLMRRFYRDASKFEMEGIISTMISMGYATKSFDGSEMIIKYIDKNKRTNTDA